MPPVCVTLKQSWVASPILLYMSAIVPRGQELKALKCICCGRNQSRHLQHLLLRSACLRKQLNMAPSRFTVETSVLEVGHARRTRINIGKVGILQVNFCILSNIHASGKSPRDRSMGPAPAFLLCRAQGNVWCCPRTIPASAWARPLGLRERQY